MGSAPKRAPATRSRASGKENGRKPSSDFLAEIPFEEDQLGFETWLLPAAKLTRGEKFVRTVSAVGGPLLFVAAVAALLYFLFIAS